MAISSDTRRSGPFIGTGKETVFPFSFKINSADHVKVVVSTDGGVTEEALSPSAFSVSLNSDQDNQPGGSVTLADPLASDSRLSVISDAPYLQPMVLTNRGGFYPETLNDSADSIVIQTQQLKEQLNRAVKVPATSTDTPEDLAKDLYDARDRAEAADKNAAASASASASSADTSKSYADKVTGFKDQIITVSDNMADVKTNAANISAIKGIGDNLTEVLKSSGYAAEAKYWADQANAIAGSEALMMPGATQALTIGQWMLRKAQVFHSVAEMKASLVLADGMSCVTGGYYEPGDGGMAFYRVRKMAESDVDDGGSVLALQNGLCAELIVENGTVNVRQFGARGDGVTDDTNAIQTALDYAYANLRNCRVSKGTFCHTGLIVPCGDWHTSNFRMRFFGDGRKASILQHTGSGDGIYAGLRDMSEAKAGGCTICGMALVGNSGTTNGIRIYGGTGFHLDDLYISKITDSCIKIDAAFWINRITNISMLASPAAEGALTCGLYMTNTGTTNYFDELYVTSATKYGYRIVGTYSTIGNLAADYCSGDYVYYFYYFSGSINSLGSEHSNVKTIAKFQQSTASVGFFCTMYVGSDSLETIAGSANNSRVSISKFSLYGGNSEELNVPIAICSSDSFFDIGNIDSSYTFNVDTGLPNHIHSALSSCNLAGTTIASRASGSRDYIGIDRINAFSKKGRLRADNCTPAIFLDCLVHPRYRGDGTDQRWSGATEGDWFLESKPSENSVAGYVATATSGDMKAIVPKPVPLILSGTTDSRPTRTDVRGLQYFDTTLGKPIWWNGTSWVDATGTTV